MTYHAVTRWGDPEDVPDEHRMRQVLAELDAHDREHPEAWLTHESGWSLSVFESGLVIWQNLESAGEARHQVGVPREKALELWLKLSRGEIEAINQEPWCPGQSPPLSDEERADLAREASELERARLASFRTFYESLGPERPEVLCRHAGCRRGAVRFSVLCRVHHFESIYNCPCPFQD